jgi:transcriptional regulator EpsA
MHEWQRFLRVAQGSLLINEREALCDWLQGEFRYFVPHEVFVAVWGNADMGEFNVHLLSPWVRATGGREDALLRPLLHDLYQQWITNVRRPVRTTILPTQLVVTPQADTALLTAAANVRSALIHGIAVMETRDDRVFIALQSAQAISEQSAKTFELLLPYVNAASERIADLGHANTGARSSSSAWLLELSQREVEIMRWLTAGKTNPEIGQILETSTFTVKNHVQRIFRKMNVVNRAQAVEKFKRSK